MSDLKTWREQPVNELRQEVKTLRLELFKLRMQKAMAKEGLLLHRFRQVRRDIARLLTIIAEKEKVV